MWVRAKMARIKWVLRVMNEEILNKIKENRRCSHTILKRKGNWKIHVIREKEILMSNQRT